jgi:hypothetical protein
MHWLAEPRVRLLDRREQPLRERLQLGLSARCRIEDRELVAADPRKPLSGADARLQTPRGIDKQRIAGFVAERAVDPLEVVEIDDERGERASGGAYARAGTGALG